MRLTSSRAYTRPTPVPKMPPGLVELMEGLSRHVLRNNPSDVYEFCANHMAKLLEVRDGTSTKQLLSLDEKILKAQEKVRQRAQERQERFDREIKLHCEKSDEDTISDQEKNTPLTQMAPVVPSLKAPIHHEHDLEHASEVEISHVLNLDAVTLAEVDKAPNGGEINVVEDNELKATSINSVELENLNNDTIAELKSEVEPIFWKVEKDLMNDEVFKTPEILEIIVQKETAESHLQTIAEVSDENSVTRSTVILPEITIGDKYDVLLLENIAEKSAQELKSDTVIEMDKEIPNENTLKTLESPNKSEGMVQNKSNDLLQNISEDLLQIKSHDLLSSEPEHFGESDLPVNTTDGSLSLIVISSVTDTENIVPGELVTKNDKKELTYTLTEEVPNNEKQQDDSMANDISNLLISTNATERDLNSVNATSVQQVVDNAPADAFLNADKSNLETPIADEANDGILRDQELNNEQSHTETKEDDTHNIQAFDASKENNFVLYGKETAVETSAIAFQSNNETEAKEKTVVESDIQKVESNEKVPEKVLIESEKTVLKEESKERNRGDDDDKRNDNAAQILFQTSDSTDNNNEDSLSVVDSDLSKTDDDSSQNNPNNMDLETAAVTIQKVFRSFMFKSRNSTFEDTTNDEHISIDEENDKKEEYYAAANLNKDRRPLGITRMDTVLQTVNEEKSLSLSTDDSSTLSSAATTIQAHVRGFLVRNRLNSSKTFSMNSLVNSHEVLDTDTEQQKNKTILNIHIVPEEGNYLSRDESIITSMDLSLDGSPPSSVNLHPLSHDISERRKMLKREDAIQSVSPPSNNSGKLSEDSVKEVLINENVVLERDPTDDKTNEIEDPPQELDIEAGEVTSLASTTTPTTVITISKSEEPLRSPKEYTAEDLQRTGTSFKQMSSDESDVITPFVPSPRCPDNATRLVHSGEFHDVVLPTKVSRNDTSVVRGE